MGNATIKIEFQNVKASKSIKQGKNTWLDAGQLWVPDASKASLGAQALGLLLKGHQPCMAWWWLSMVLELELSNEMNEYQAGG